MGEVLLRDIIERLGGELVGDPATRIESIEPLESAGRAAISFLSNPIYDKQLASSQWIVGDELSIADCAAVPALFYAVTLQPFPASCRR